MLRYFICLLFSYIPMSASATTQKKVVLSSFSIIGDITQNIAKDLVTVTTLVEAGNDSHSYQVTSADAIKIQN
ncbi:metal ABC transporter solute-binding protein, Zn/Mn family, partial [Candidatus Liberibacter asiaticus]